MSNGLPFVNTNPAPAGQSEKAPPTELEQRILTEIMCQWRVINGKRFLGRLSVPRFSTFQPVGCLGQWRNDQRLLCLDATFTKEGHWGQVLEELTRQMVHQYVDEVCGLTSEPGHTAAYLLECQQRGIGSGAGNRDTLSEDARRALRRVMQLLALAESPNRHEAEAAMAEAQRLMLQHNLKVAPQIPRAGTEYETQCLGRHKRRFTLAERYTAETLDDHFFVRSIWRYLHDPRDMKEGWVLEIYGTPTNLAMASYVFDFLGRTGERLWREYKRAHGLTSDRDRRSYLAGVVQGFDAKLAAQQKMNQAEGLVWLGDKELKEFDERRYPPCPTLKLPEHPWDDARRHGFADGKNIALHLPVEEKGNARPAGGPRLTLPG
jgi:hypothetical protein